MPQAVKVIIDDAVTSATTGGIYINHTGTYQTASLDADGNIVYTSHNLPTAGTIEFNSDVTQGMLVFDGGTMHVTKDNGLHITEITVNNGILDLTTNDTETQNLGKLTLNNVLDLKIDAALASATADVIGANSESALGNAINLTTVNLTSAMADQYRKIYISDSVLKDTLTGNGSSELNGVTYGWQVKNDDSAGAYILVKKVDFHNFITSVRYDDDPNYNMTDNINVAEQIEQLGDTPDAKDRIGAIKSGKTTYIINGGGYTIDGHGKKAIEVANGQTFTSNDVAEWKDFDGVAIDNAGITNIKAVDYDSAISSGIKNINKLNILAKKDISIASISDSDTPSGTTTIGDTTGNYTGSVNFNGNVTQKN